MLLTSVKGTVYRNNKKSVIQNTAKKISQKETCLPYFLLQSITFSEETTLMNIFEMLTSSHHDDDRVVVFFVVVFFQGVLPDILLSL